MLDTATKIARKKNELDFMGGFFFLSKLSNYVNGMIPPHVFPLHVLYLTLPEYSRNILQSHRNLIVVTFMEEGWRSLVGWTDFHFFFIIEVKYS